MRHANSRSDEGVEDQQRSLSIMGERDAQAMATWLVARGFRPDVILCSQAKRAESTAAIVGKAFGLEPKVDGRLYHASPGTYLDVADEHEGLVMLVGHNPTMEEALAAWVPEVGLHGQMAPGCVAVIDVQAHTLLALGRPGA